LQTDVPLDHRQVLERSAFADNAITNTESLRFDRRKTAATPR
jgi:hypothetical protein